MAAPDRTDPRAAASTGRCALGRVAAVGAPGHLERAAVRTGGGTVQARLRRGGAGRLPPPAASAASVPPPASTAARSPDSSLRNRRAAATRSRSIAAEVFAHWTTAPNFAPSAAHPGRCRARGRDASFETLAQSVTTDVHPRSILEELMRLGIGHARCSEGHGGAGTETPTCRAAMPCACWAFSATTSVTTSRPLSTTSWATDSNTSSRRYSPTTCRPNRWSRCTRW